MGGEHVLHFAGADTKSHGAEGAVGGGVTIPTHHRDTRHRQPELRAHDVDDALFDVTQRVQANTELFCIVAKGLDLQPGRRLGNRLINVNGGRVVVFGGDERYLARVEEGSDKSPAEPWSSWDLTLDSFVDMCRSEPSFRQLGFGDIIHDRFLDNEISNNTVVSTAFAGMVSETHNIPVTDQMLFHIETAVWMGSALLNRAFQSDPVGDERFIEEARRVIGDYLRTNVPIPS